MRKVIFPLILVAAVAVLLFIRQGAQSKQEAQPVIGFVGVAEGTLSSDVKQLKFQDRFDAVQQKLVGVAAFDHVAPDTSVTAQLFSPDDELPPVAHTTLKTVSG